MTIPTLRRSWKSTLVRMAVLLCIPASLFPQSQNAHLDRLSVEHGLSQSTVNCIVQDGLGFMWFGTADGLNRYDGHTFKVFTHDDQDPSSLSHPFVVTIAEDREGALWVGTLAGLNRFDRTTEAFEHFRNDPSDPTSLSHDRIRVIYEDRSGVLWIGTSGGGLDKFDRASQSFERFNHDPSNPSSLSDNHILALHEDGDGVLWVGTRGGGLNRFDAKTQTFVQYRHDPGDPASLSHDVISAIYEDRDGALWVGTGGGGINKLDRTTGGFVRYLHHASDGSSLSSNSVEAIFQDDRGVLWVGTDNGLNEWNAAAESFVRYRHDPVDPRSLSGDAILALYQDRGGVLWIGTGVGVNKWNTTTERFRSFTADASSPSISNNAVTAFYEGPDETIWIGTYGGGLDRLNRSTGTFTHYLHDPSKPESLSDDRVMSLLVDSHGVLWAGTFAGGLDRFHGRGFEHYQHEPESATSLSENGVTSVYEDGSGVLWVGTFGGGLNRFDPARDSFIHYRHDVSNPTSLSHDAVMVIYQDRGGILWIGTDGGGLNRFDRRTGTFTSYRHDPEKLHSLTSNSIYSLYEDADRVLWIGTDAGLNGWSLKDRNSHRSRFERFKERQGLPNDVIYGILPDDEGNLWLSTNKGLSKFNPRLKRFRNYTTAQGLQSNEFNFGAHHRAANGEMFFGGINGFNAFYPDRIRDNPHMPPIVWTGFWKFNQKVELEKPLWETDAIELGHRDYAVSFEFAALDYSAPELNRYAYKLEGFDEDWIELGTLRRTTYTNLDPGNYILRVKASNNDGVWNEEGVALKVRVIPPPWRTWWAYSIYASLLVGVVFAYTRAQAKKLERKEEYSRKLEQQVHERTQELAERNDELQQANKKLEEASLTDSITGLRNRRYLMTHIHEDLALVERQYVQLSDPDRKEPTPDYLFLMIDLDGFKEVNDVHGHAAGDRVLQQMGERLQQACRKSDTIIRWGGDEFMVVGRCVHRQAAETVAERIRSAIQRDPFDLGSSETTHLCCSIGFALYPFLPWAPALFKGEQLMSIADRALYVAKASGRNAWVGIFGTDKTLAAHSLETIKDRLDTLVLEGAIEITSSVQAPKMLVLDSAKRGKAAAPTAP